MLSGQPWAVGLNPFGIGNSRNDFCATGFTFNMDERNRKSFGTKLFVGLLLFFCVLGVLAIAIPNFIKARAIPSAQPCINNLRQIEAAANEFALENHKNIGDPIIFPDDLTPYIRLNREGKIPSCPVGGVYSIKKIGDKPTCSLGKANTDGYLHELP